MTVDDAVDAALLGAVGSSADWIPTHEILDRALPLLPGVPEHAALERLEALLARGEVEAVSDHGTVYVRLPRGRGLTTSGER